MLLIMLLSGLIYRNIILPLKSLQHATNRISEGDFDIRLNEKFVSRKDELGELAKSFNTMAKKIHLQMGRQRQLIQDISHELRTPVTRIKLILADVDHHPSFKRVEQEVNSMQTLLEDTLTLSWLNNEDTQMVKETVDLILLLEAICEDASFEFSRNDIHIDGPETCVVHNSNHRAIGQALENIIRNAMKYTESGVPINISLNVDEPEIDSSVRIIIEDQGQGIGEQYLEEIFEPFFRINAARDNSVGGYGLGLALSKRQIEAVGGMVFAKNSHPHGLMFVIEIPVSVI
jgi:two-component system sensor histidine kinase PfeS